METLQIAYNDSYGAEKTVYGEIDETGKTGTVSFTPTSTDISYIEVRATATTDEPTLKGYGAINVYNVTLENLNEFAQKRFFTATDGSNAIVNLGDYVNRIKRVFVDIPTSGTDTLKCGNYDTKISVLAPNTDIITVDFGNVTLTGVNVISLKIISSCAIFLFINLIRKKLSLPKCYLTYFTITKQKFIQILWMIKVKNLKLH